MTEREDLAQQTIPPVVPRKARKQANHGGGGNRTRVLFPSLAAAAVFVASGIGFAQPSLTEFGQARKALRVKANEARDRRCRPPVHRFRFRAIEVHEAARAGVLRYWRAKLGKVRAERSRCWRTSPRGAIVHVFGPTAAAALAVARCESGLYPQALGAAGERGLFQIHPVHAEGLGATWGRLFDPVVNARVAYRMSAGGTDWGPWTCKP